MTALWIHQQPLNLLMLTIFTFQNNSFNSGVKNGYFQNLILFSIPTPNSPSELWTLSTGSNIIRWSIFVCLLTLFLSPRKCWPISQSYRGRDELMAQRPCGPQSLGPSLSGPFQKKSAPLTMSRPLNPRKSSVYYLFAGSISSHFCSFFS